MENVTVEALREQMRCIADIKYLSEEKYKLDTKISGLQGGSSGRTTFTAKSFESHAHMGFGGSLLNLGMFIGFLSIASFILIGLGFVGLFLFAVVKYIFYYIISRFFGGASGRVEWGNGHNLNDGFFTFIGDNFQDWNYISGGYVQGLLWFGVRALIVCVALVVLGFIIGKPIARARTKKLAEERNMEEIRKEKEREIEKRRLPELTSQRDKMRARISALERRLNELTESDGAPRAYANIETLNALIGYLENKRADSLKEAINLWVGEKKIEEIQQRQEEIEERKKDDLLRLTNPLAWNEKHGIYIPHTESVYKESPFGDKLITYENGKKVGVVYSDGSSKFYKDGKWVFDKNKNTHGGL